MTTLAGAVPRMMRPGAGQNYPRSGFPLEGKDGTDTATGRDGAAPAAGGSREGGLGCSRSSAALAGSGDRAIGSGGKSWKTQIGWRSRKGLRHCSGARPVLQPAAPGPARRGPRSFWVPPRGLVALPAGRSTGSTGAQVKPPGPARLGGAPGALRGGSAGWGRRVAFQKATAKREPAGSEGDVNAVSPPASPPLLL